MTFDKIHENLIKLMVSRPSTNRRHS